MKEIGGKQFPTVWSELFLTFEDVKGKVDTDQSISFKDIIEWITEYNSLNFEKDTMNGNLLDDLTKKGKVLHTFLNTVKEKIKHMHGSEELSFNVWCANTKTNYTGGGTKDPSEAARDRMLLIDKEYQTRKTILIRLLVMVETADSLLWDMNGMISHIQVKLEAMRKEQPRLP